MATQSLVDTGQVSQVNEADNAAGQLLSNSGTPLTLSATPEWGINLGPITGLTYPYDAVCMISADFGDGFSNQGSGAIIGPHTILTASHVLWDSVEGQGASALEIYPAFGGGAPSSSTTMVTGRWIDHYNQISDPGTESNSDMANDFAIIDVAQDLSPYGSFAVLPNFGGGGPVHLTGYPADANGEQTDITAYRVGIPLSSDLFYDDSTAALMNQGDKHGMSGGPMWIDGIDGVTTPSIVGVIDTTLGGAQLTTNDLQTINNWISEDSYLWADDFAANTTTTGRISVNGAATGSLENYRDHDWFAVNLTAGTRYRIDLDGVQGGGGTLYDPYLQLYDGSSNLMGSDDDGETRDSQLYFRPTFSGTYYVDAGAYQDNGTGTYTVRVAVDNSGPNGSNRVAVHGQSLTASSLFTAVNLAGGAIAQYGFWDTGTGGGHFVLNGLAQATNQEIDVSAAQLAQLSYQSGSGTDTLWVRANDGYQWSNWSSSFTVTAPIDNAPVVVVSNLTAAHGQSLAAGTLAQVSDADGDTTTKIAFWNTGTGGGHFVFFGVAQSTNQELDFATGQAIFGLSYQSGSGADTLWVRAYDGYQWSAWSNSFTVTAPIDNAPVVTPTVSKLMAGHGQSFAAASLFKVSDDDGDAMTSFAFWDAGTGDAHFSLNGVAQSANQEIDVTAAQLAQLNYQSRSGTDTLWGRANDGYQWSAWSSSFTVTAPIDNAPVVTPTASKLMAGHGQSFAAASLFKVSDDDGDAMTSFAFRDAGTGGAHFSLNGVAQSANQEIDITAAQLSQMNYQSGSGADTLWVRAYDGYQWSAWSNSFTVTAPIDSGPTIIPTNGSIKSFPNQTFAASSLTIYLDPFGSPAAQYDFWNSGAGGGHFLLNGSALPANQDNIISAAQLGQLSYQVGTGTDTLWVRANDGTVWGAWSNSFTISDPPAVGAGETITLGSAFAGMVNFLSDRGTLKLENSSSFTGTVAGLCGQDTIDFADIGFGTNSTLGYAANSDHSGGTLSVGDGTHVANIALLGSYMASTFAASSDGHGGTLISEAAHASTQMPVVTQPHA
jgi:Bacterial pre-peptidase C-terminal domain